jgi:predicted CXXCH cytochrome family protein
MQSRFRDAEHLVRLLVLFAAGTLFFLVVRAFAVPQGFGEYGHFRTGAIADSRARPLSFAGRQACVECHEKEAKSKTTGAHKPVGCESCHGPLAAHAADPKAVKPELPQVPALCVRCHERLSSRPSTFPQVDAVAHAEGNSCIDCHDPHSPDA